jgi:hypothetical protein
MKKIFTLAAAVLASFSLMAQDYVTLFSTDFSDASWEGHDTICNGATAEETVNGIFFRSNNNSKYYTIADGALTFCDNNSGNNYFMAIPVQNVTDSVIVVLGTVSNSQRVNYLFRETNEISASSVSMSSTAANINTNQSITIRYKMSGDGDEALVMLGRQGSGQKTVIKSITIYTIASAPLADPVASVTVAGPTEAFVGQKASFSATTDVKANAYKWFVNDAEQEGATSAKFDFTPDAEGSYSIVCQAKNDNNADFVASEAIVLVASVKQALEQVSISENTTWDWNYAASVNEIKLTDATSPAKNERCLLANLDGMNNDANFNSQALLFEGEYAMRIQSNMKLAQGQFMGFNTTVAGYLTVEYSNTGNRTAGEGETEGQESERRFITVNGNLVEGDAGSMKSNETVLVENIPVAAGDVAISALRPYSDNPEAIQYVRFYKIQFSTEPIATGINNAEEAVKAAKVIRNGQLFIEKNGVLYNAQGATVK